MQDCGAVTLCKHPVESVLASYTTVTWLNLPDALMVMVPCHLLPGLRLPAGERSDPCHDLHLLRRTGSVQLSFHCFHCELLIVSGFCGTRKVSSIPRYIATLGL